MRLRDDYGPTFLGFTLAFVAGFSALAVLAALGVNALTAKSCHDKAALYGLTVDYGMWTGCNVQGADGKFTTSLDQWLIKRVEVVQP